MWNSRIFKDFSNFYSKFALLSKEEESNSFTAKNSQISLHSSHELLIELFYSKQLSRYYNNISFQTNRNSFESGDLAKQHEILRSEWNVLPPAHRRSILNRMGIFGLHLSRNKSYGVSVRLFKKYRRIKSSSLAFNKRIFVSKRGVVKLMLIGDYRLITIGFAYFGMFLSIWKTRHACSLSVGDSEFALRFFLIVLTDAACWVPIIVLKIRALLKYPIPGKLNLKLHEILIESR